MPGRRPAVIGAVVTGARRLVTVTALLAFLPVVATALVCVTVVTCPFSLRRGGRWRPVRIASFALLYLVVDLTGLIAAAVAWLRSPSRSPAGRARLREATYAIAGRLLGLLRRAATRNFGLTVDVTPAVPDVGEEGGPGSRGPLLVFVRHAGPGDSFLLIHTLLAEARLYPHIVLKSLLRLDPWLDVLLSRLPHCFVPAAGSAGTAEGVATLAAGLRTGDALVLFPEGGNFTERRHRRAIAALRRHGKRRTAARAARMHHVLPPHTAGALAALNAAPTTDVVFVAHTGLDAIHSVRSGWSAIPLRDPVRAHWWRVPAAEIPPGDEARSEWLLTQWTKIDTWIGSRAEET